MTTQQCTRCFEVKPLDDFSRDGKRVIKQCKACRAEHWRLWHADRRQADKERRENRKFNNLMRSWPEPNKLYGIE